MKVFLLSVHVLAAIIFIGPVTVAASMFPPLARRALADGGPDAVLVVLHRVSRVYAVGGVTVPVFGIATATALGVLTEPWLLVSMAITAGAAAVLLWAVLPAQAAVLSARAGDRGARAGARPEARRL